MALRMRGAQSFRQRLVCATLAGTPFRIDEIRASDSNPGLRDFEANLLRLLEKVTNGCVVEINETGTRLRYKPGVIVCGGGLVHDCGTSRGIGYFLEPLILLALFAKKNLQIVLRGVTNGLQDPGVDTFRTTTLPLLRQFGVSTDGLELRIVKRGAPPLGGGEVMLKVPVVGASLQAVNWTDEGMVKRIRGVAYSARVSPQMANRMVDSARGVLNRLLPDVYIFTDHYTGAESGKSPGYGLALVAESTSGCLISTEATAEVSSAADERDREAGPAPEALLPEDIGARAAHQLLDEIRQGGVVDSTHQGFLFMLCALCPEDVSKVRVGRLSPNAIRMLRCIKDFFGVQFSIKPDSATGTVILSCVGSGYKNLSRKVG
ncbi:RNA 3'-terminal phosphate cyclase [Klebsormidium nitens]|uniref:RNA 3'-terminal phosphate cyclase n=1 Tax=Klebsormidium nitens TaxID=105231 RepID=A0A1Y1IKR1_KLENI|nr:RNA 3'-terminal phosphate cyclase [Klebsormidium nitens]|eukprot:GAQ89366.1 RNA 3'-terminal phosphate cyclase [Klebsormidium nitens]